MQLRLMLGVFSNADHISLFFNDIPLHEPPLQASSSTIPRIRIWPIRPVIILVQVLVKTLLSCIDIIVY